MAAPRQNDPLTQAELKEWLHYDPETGVFTWLRSSGKSVHVGQQAGNGRRKAGGKRRRMVIGLKGKKYHAARLAWFYMTGAWPTALVDHEDGDMMNQRWKNLRDVSVAVNGENQKRATAQNKTSGLLGVCWVTRREHWQAGITVRGKYIYLGSFIDKHEAHQAYLEAKRRLHAGCTI